MVVEDGAGAELCAEGPAPFRPGCGHGFWQTLIGIVNTMSLSIHERTRELGLLRAVGMTTRQLRRTVRYESAIIALIGTLAGLVLGLFFGWAAFEATGAARLAAHARLTTSGRGASDRGGQCQVVSRGVEVVN